MTERGGIVPTVIRVKCGFCKAESELRPSGIHLWAYDHGQQTYSFFCPKCTEENVKDAPDQVLNLLLAGGVAMSIIHVPLEFLEPKEGPPISCDDVMDFVVALRDVEYLHQREPEVEGA
jgi:hypothetical protein